MPVPPPVDDPTQRYPLAIRDFCTYADQPQDGTKFIQAGTNPDGSAVMVDLTIDAAAITSDLHQEIISIERTMGPMPKVTQPYNAPKQGPSMGGSIQWLYRNKAWVGHAHVHAFLTALTGDDHLQYMRADAARSFTHPVICNQRATKSNQLVRLDQCQGVGLTVNEIEELIQDALEGGVSNGISGTAGAGHLTIMGGVAKGYTDINGNLYVPFGGGFHQVLLFVYTKMPFPGMSMLGWYAYQYMEDQLILMSLDNHGAIVQFIEDITVDRQALVCMCWIAVGI